MDQREWGFWARTITASATGEWWLFFVMRGTVENALHSLVLLSCNEPVEHLMLPWGEFPDAETALKAKIYGEESL